MSDWQSEIDEFLATKEQKQKEQVSKIEANRALVAPFIEGKVLPAFEEVKAALERHDRRVEIESHNGPDNAYASFRVYCGKTKELDYTIEVRVSDLGAIPVPVNRFWDRVGGRMAKHEGNFATTHHAYDVHTLTPEEIRHRVLKAYKSSADIVQR